MVDASSGRTIGGMASMMTVRVLVAVLPQMSMAIDRGRAPRSVRQKSSIGCALFLERTKLPIVVFRSATRKETRCPTINQVSRVKIQIRSLASRVKTQIKNPANRHRIPAKAASQATRNKKQAARFGGPLYLVYMFDVAYKIALNDCALQASI